MNLKELIPESPEINEDKVIAMIKEYSDYLSTEARNRLRQLHKDLEIEYAILEEYNLIQEKKSYLTSGQRKQIEGLVALCLIRLSKGDESKDDLEKEITNDILDGVSSSNN